MWGTEVFSLSLLTIFILNLIPRVSWILKLWVFENISFGEDYIQLSSLGLMIGLSFGSKCCISYRFLISSRIHYVGMLPFFLLWTE